jgi:hypothetical protein
MLKLRLNNTAASWLDLGNGVRVLVPACSTATLRVAEREAFRACADARLGMGLEDGDAQTEEQTSDIEGVFVQARIRAFASKIEGWEGIVGDDEQPLPITPEALDAFAAHPALGGVFVRRYETGVIELVKEGNGSGNSGSGKPPEAKAIAETVPAAAEPAPAS